jgi:hypothetical protein
MPNNALEFYTIYDPITESDDEVLGGPWCFSINEERAYLAFPNKSLAEDFIRRWHKKNNRSEYEIIPLNLLGTEYEELVEDVTYLLVLPTIRDIKHLVSNLESFPYNHYIVPRSKHLVH